MSLFRTRGRIRREAADWVARLGSRADEETRDAFRRWYQADQRHAAAFDRMAAIWSAAGRASPSRLEGRSGAGPARSPRRSLGFAMAASLVAGIALVSVLLFGTRWLPDSARGEEETLSLASVIGEIKQVELPDGSRLVLDSGSRIEVRFTRSERRLTLREGRARFTVAHESRPFIVGAGSSEVIATGTVFDVSLIDDRLAVVLLEGSVEVRQRAASREAGVHQVQAGQKLVIAGDAAPVRRQAARGETLWPTNMLEFDDTPLHEAVAQVNRYSRIQLRLGDERTRNLRVSGAYRAGDVAGFARSLAVAFGLRLESQPDGSLLLAHPAPAAR